ncbi:hypothetical protein DFH09DRAFT_1355913 [Mycena vulgaris]|nr:hypothetical protein DFH09DRAFT_1355913 [Mycena vulgaris]
MSLSSYIKRQSHTRTRKSSISLAVIAEEVVEEATPTHKKSKSVKARRRLGVSDLCIPRASPLFTAVQGPAVWRLTLDDSPDTFDFPRPPCDESSGSGSGSGSDSGSLSSPATTPSPSPTIAAHSVPCLARCKSIKPLTITKRNASPPPPPAESPAPTESTPEQQVEELWEDDDDFYAAHAGTFITLAAPLPPSFPASSSSAHASTSRSRRESVVLPGPAPTPSLHRASVRLSRTIFIPTRPPPPPPIITSLPLPSLYSTASLAVPPSRPPPRTPIPTDAQSGDYTLLAASLSPLLSPGPFSARSASPSPSSSPSSSSSAHRLAALLSPPPARQFVAEPHGVPSDVDDEWEEYESEHAYGDVPLSPLVAPAPASSSPSPIEDGECSPIEYAAADADENEDEQPAYFPPTPRTPHHGERVLRSRWSSSTLSSVHSAHAHAPRSPRTFAFARRYFPSASPAKIAVKPMYPARAGKKPAGKGKGKRLTAADVRVLGLGSAAPSSSSSSSSSPASAATSTAPTSPSSFLALQTPATAQFASYPYPPSPASPPSAALYAAYTTQRSPRRRASTASASSRSSSRSSSSAWHSGQSESGHSDFSVASAGGEGGLRRKPIPVGLFLR